MEDELKSPALADAESLIFCPVNDFSSFTGFSCGDEDLDDFIRGDAARYHMLSVMMTYGLYLPEDKERATPLSFASLLSSSLEFSGSIKKATKINCFFPFLPVVKLERFGVHCRLQNKGIGRNTIENVISTLTSRRIIGYRLLIVDAYRAAVPFYEKVGFTKLPNPPQYTTTVPMFLDLQRWKTR